jgi:hypothetical protein
MSDADSPKSPAAAAAPAARPREARAWVLGLLGWLVPGLGHLLQKKLDRAAVFFVSICAMAALGLAMGAKLYGPPFARDQGLFLLLLHVLGFVGDLGAGLLFFAARYAGLGQAYLGSAVGDYGTVFFLGAGLLNLLTALDAYDVAVGKKE